MKKLVLAMAVLSTSVMTSGCGVYSYYSAKQEYENGLLADRARTQEKAAKKAQEKAEKKARDNFLAKNCQTTIPDSRFINNQNGTVTDTKTGLIWKRCIEGQSGSECEVDPVDQTKGVFSVESAQKHVRSINNASFAGYRDWRIPKIEELKTIFDPLCYPHINKHIFPNSLFTNRYFDESVPFLSSSYKGSIYGPVLSMDFDSESGELQRNPESYHALRLVRSDR